ncbi:MAG: hypothetical protein QOG59_3561 [Solirubrobacteraceae bacterium]|nr:hypothetical protein [Solirubrobacteraceae bacterium]
MAQLVLGPLLRYVDEHAVTVWVETDVACEVEVLGRRASTFHVAGHHYAVVAVEDLAPGEAHDYEVALDGERRWPAPGVSGPGSRITPLDPERGLRLAFGSCRASAPHEAPWTRSRREHPQGRGSDALRALARRLRDQPASERPSLLLMVGDQVYADDAAPQTRAFIRGRRSTEVAPGEEVVDFEEYTRLYREAWSDPDIRWLLSTLPSAMIFDDHEVVDDWNISEAWRREMSARPWWADRIAGALMAYWIYQHLGNLSPVQLRAEPMLAAVQASDDGAALLRDFALRSDRGGAGTRWSYSRRLGCAHLVVVDSRAGRMLEPGRRQMVDDDQWRWLDAELRGDVDHLLLATSLPYLLPQSIHAAEAWSEAICDGAWGSRVAKLGERLRRLIDLEHWAAFGASIERLAAMLAEVSAGRRGRAPATIVLLSGDVHYGYLAEAHFPGRATESAVYQAVASPFRQGLTRPMELANRLAFTRAMGLVGVLLLAITRLPRPSIRWRTRQRPVFANQIAILDLHTRTARLRWHAVAPGEADLRRVAEHELR